VRELMKRIAPRFRDAFLVLSTKRLVPFADNGPTPQARHDVCDNIVDNACKCAVAQTRPLAAAAVEPDMESIDQPALGNYILPMAADRSFAGISLR
jgi:hypothetical protein